MSTKTATPSKTRKLLYYSIPYGVIIVTLIVFEIGVRLSLPTIPSIRYFVSGPTHADDPAGASVFEGDPLLGWRLRANLKNVWWDYTYFSTNNNHIRYHHNVGDKPENGFRILCLGDSVTFGYRVPVSWPDNPGRIDPDAAPFFKLIEKRLQRLLPGKKVECVPLAVPGYSSHQGLAWLKQDIDFYRPDIVIVCFGWNDTDYRSIEDKASLPTDPFSVILRSMASKSQAILHIVKGFSQFKAPSTPGNQVNRVSSEDYIKNMMAIVSLAKTHGSRIVVMGQFYRDSITNPRQARIIAFNRRNLKKSCEKNQITYIEIETLTEKAYPNNKHLFGELIHPNALGHRMIADRLMRHIVLDK